MYSYIVLEYQQGAQKQTTVNERKPKKRAPSLCKCWCLNSIKSRYGDFSDCCNVERERERRGDYSCLAQGLFTILDVILYEMRAGSFLKNSFDRDRMDTSERTKETYFLLFGCRNFQDFHTREMLLL
jgi:hypothetical protein